MDIDFVFKIYTNDIKSLSIYKDRLGQKLELNGYIKREELLKIMGSADFLINIKNIGVVQAPSKMIDYTLAKRPILSITSDFNDMEKEKFTKFCNYDFSMQDQPVDISAYDIRNVASKFLELYTEK